MSLRGSRVLALYARTTRALLDNTTSGSLSLPRPSLAELVP